MDFVYFPSLIIGSGIAGLTASIYLSEASIPCMVFEGAQIGGALMQSDSVRNWPGIVNESGKQIIEKVRRQAKHSGAQLFSTVVENVDVVHYRPLFRVKTRDVHPEYRTNLFLTETLVVATGSTPKKLGLEGERELLGRGLFTCAICESSLVRGGTVAIVGGGDSAIAMSLYLVPLVKRLFLLVRGKKFCAKDLVRVKQLFSHTQGTIPVVKILFNTRVVSMQQNAEKRLGSVRLQNGDKEWTQPLDALFLAIGIVPNTELFPTLVKRPDGTLQTFRYQETSQPGIFAAGDVCDSMFRQAITGSAQGAQSAIQIKSFLDERGLAGFSKKEPQLVWVQNGVHILPLTSSAVTCKSDTCTRAPQKSETCKSQTCAPRNIYEAKRKHVPQEHSEDEEDSPIQEILTVQDWENFTAKHSAILLEVMSSSCLTCGSVEFVVRELPSRFPSLAFARMDLELIDPKDLEVIGQKLDIPKKIELPYFAKIVQGRNVQAIQGENQVSQSKLVRFLQQ